MIDEKIFEMFQKLTDKLQENTDALKAMLANHETRLTVLEKGKEDNWKTQLLLLMAKALVIGLVSIASLVGGGSLIMKVLGVS